MKARLFFRMVRLLSRHSGRHRRGVEAVQSGLHAAAVGQHRAAPGLVGGIVEIRPHHLGQRHRAVADRLQQLIDDRHRWRIERRHAGPIEDEAPAGAREQAEDDRMLAPGCSCWKTLAASP